MEELPIKYKEFLEKILQFLWTEWSSIGVAGSGFGRKTTTIVDPEALLLFSFSICRYDQRLYDEIMDWLNINGKFINGQRLVTIQERYHFYSGPQISAAAEYLSLRKEYTLKWKKISSLYHTTETVKLFQTLSGKVIPVKEPDPVFLRKGLYRNVLKIRGYSREFPQTGESSLLLRMRALFGINARSELICLLGNVREVYPAEAARLTGYERRTIQSILLEMSKSGILDCHSGGKEKYYRLRPGILDSLLPASYKWINWPPVLKGLEILINGLQSSIPTHNPLILSSELRRYAQESSGYFNESPGSIFLSDSSKHPGEDYINIFIDDINRIISSIEMI